MEPIDFSTTKSKEKIIPHILPDEKMEEIGFVKIKRTWVYKRLLHRFDDTAIFFSLKIPIRKNPDKCIISAFYEDYGKPNDRFDFINDDQEYSKEYDPGIASDTWHFAKMQMDRLLNSGVISKEFIEEEK